MTQENEFKKIVLPVIEWMNKLHPHYTIIITNKDAELVEGKLCYSVDNDFEEIPMFEGTKEQLDKLKLTHT